MSNITKKSGNTFVIILMIFLAMLLFNSFYIVDQRQYALVSRFGNVVAVRKEPGIKLMLPFIERVFFFDNRLQNINFRADDTNEVITSDQKTMKLESFAKYRVIDPLKFYRAVQNEFAFKIRLASIFESTIREASGKMSFLDILGTGREKLMDQVVDIVSQEMIELGIEIVDARITRVGLPEKARMSVYQRMRTDREKEAAEIRAQGNQEADIVRAQALKEEVMLLAEADKNANIIRGEGDARSAEIIAQASKSDLDFYNYYRSMESYKKIFAEKNTTILLDINRDPMFDHINKGY